MLCGSSWRQRPTSRTNKLVEPDVLVWCSQKVPRDVLEVPKPADRRRGAVAQHRVRWTSASKLQGYFTVPSLQHYLVIDPDRPLLIHHKRGTGDAIETRIVGGPSLRLDPPGLDVDLTEVLAS